MKLEIDTYKDGACFFTNYVKIAGGETLFEIGEVVEVNGTQFLIEAIKIDHFHQFLFDLKLIATGHRIVEYFYEMCNYDKVK